MDVGWFIPSLALVLAGVAGTVVPLLPGLPLVLAGVLLYALGTGLAAGVGLGHVVIYVLLGGAAMVFGLAANALGARVAGGTRYGAIGAVLGLLAGLFVPPFGVLVGPFIGAVALELWAGQRGRQALRSGAGAALGFLAETVVELAVALGIAASFVFSALSAR